VGIYYLVQAGVVVAAEDHTDFIVVVSLDSIIMAMALMFLIIY
jgi:hypothetical protein